MKRVALMGSSLALASIGAALTDAEDLTFLSLELPCDTAAAQLAAFAPDVVIFDLAADTQQCLFSALSGRPDIGLIGFDLQSHGMLLLSGERANLSTAQDLKGAVTKLTSAGFRPRRTSPAEAGVPPP